MTVSGSWKRNPTAWLSKMYILSAHIPGRNSNTPVTRRNSDDRAGNSFCRPTGEYEPGGRYAQVYNCYVLKHCPEEMRFFNNFVDKSLLGRLENLVESKFGHITYSEAIEILKKSGEQFEYPVAWGHDLQTEHERYITEKHFGKPVFVTDYPKEFKAFYMRMNDDGRTVAAMDLLVPGVGEIIGGSQREERYDYLEKRLDELGLNKKDYWWYLDLRKYGGAPHAGFGLGFERLLMYLTGMTNIRDVISFPRTPKMPSFNFIIVNIFKAWSPNAVAHS